MKTVLSLLLLATAATAAAAERPHVQLPAEVPRVELRKLRLDNGLQVTLIPFGDIPKVVVTLSIDAGNVEEKADEIWIADIAGFLMELGTEKLDASGIARTAAAWGGRVNVGVTPDTMFVTGIALAEHAPDLLGLMADVTQRPSLPASELPRLQADMMRRIQLYRSQTASLADQRLAEVTYPGQPYGRYMPTEEIVKGYSIEKARAFYERYVHAGRAHLYVAGRFDAAAVEKAVRDGFGPWRGGAAAPARKFKAVSGRRIHFVERTGAVQSTLRLAIPVIQPGHPDFVALQVADTLLGGAFASRITSNIREQKGYTYAPGSSIDTPAGAGDWVYRADVTTNVTGAALKEIFGEIDRLARTPPPEEELQSIKGYLIGAFLLQQSSRDGIVGWQRFLDQHGLPPTFDYVAEVRAVTPAKVSALVKKYLDAKKMTIVVVGDGKTVLPQLKGIAPVARR